jgi:hypothetical protein
MKEENQKALERARFFQNYFAEELAKYQESESAEGLELSQLWITAIRYSERSDALLDSVKTELESLAENCSMTSARLIDLALQSRAWLKSAEKREKK